LAQQEELRRQQQQQQQVYQQRRDRRSGALDTGRSGSYQTYSRVQQQQLQRQRWAQYNSRWSNWQQIRLQRQRELERERRRAYLRYQQRYWDRIRADQLRLQQARYYDYLVNDYRYNRGGNYYYTSSYGAQMLQDAINRGYEEGYYAGQADRNDGWDFDYQNSYGYQDATFGYDSYYVGLDEYSYYFRQGFQRGYDDGYYGQDQYGTYQGGKYQILGSILGAILDIVQY
jgi:hypothetical protein